MPQTIQPLPDNPAGSAAATVRLEYKIVGGFLMGILIVALVGFISFQQVRRHYEFNQLVIHTYEVIGRIGDIDRGFEQVESGGRGYLITTNKNYLDAYQDGINRVTTALVELQRLTKDNPVQQERVEILKTLSNRAIQALHTKIDQRDREGLEAVAKTFGAEAKENADQVRFAVGGMRRTELELLNQRTSESEVAARHTLTSFFVLLGLALVGLAAFFTFIWRDLENRRKTEQALRESDARFRGVLESAPDAMFILDETEEIRIVNSEAVKLFGFTRDDLIGRSGAQLLVGRCEDETVVPLRVPGTVPVSMRESEEAMAHFHTLTAKFDGVRKDGTLFPAEISRSPIEVGDKLWSITAVRDRTEQERAEDALSKFSLELARSNAELERFAYVASHDLQEPLRMVSSYTQLLSRRYKGKLDEDADEFIAYAVDGANRMQKLINDLLTLSRVGTQARPSESVETGGILRRVLSDMKETIEAAGAEIVMPEQMPAVLADGTQIGQLFQNLVGNALKFGGDQTPRLEVTFELSGEDFWRFSFRDNGIGIEPQYFDRIFVIFQRLHGKESYPGTGIGLAICKKIVERHGGQLWVESEPGHGANFLFTLPAST